jgi:hypothetical protein
MRPAAQQEEPHSTNEPTPAGGRHRWYLHSLRAVQAERPFILPLLAGFLLVSVAGAFLSPMPRLSLAMSLAGECTLVYAVARRLQAVQWIRKRRWLTLGLWLANAAASATLVVYAFDDYRSLRDPNTWIQVSSHVFSVSRADTLLHEGYYLIDLDPGSTLQFEKVDFEGIPHGPVRKVLDKQIAMSQGKENLFAHLLMTVIRNHGTHTLSSLQLQMKVGYSFVRHKNDVSPRTEPPGREVEIPIGGLRSGEDFVFVAFSTNPEMYARGELPDLALARMGDEERPRKLKVNYPEDYRLFGKTIVTRGLEAPTGAGSTVSRPH